LTGSLFVELFLIKKVMLKDQLRKLTVVDGIYGISSVALVATGLLRVFYFGKGDAYYFANWVFILKFSLFIFVGLLSIYPTVLFLKLNKKLKKSTEASIEIPRFATIKGIVISEILLVLIIPLLAILMAQGVGMAQ
jgi:putative membrane protein